MSAFEGRETAVAGVGFHAPQRIVTFLVDGRTLGVDVSSVREIKGWQPTTPIPNAPAHVLGVVNLRGVVIAVHDLRQCIGLGATSVSGSNVVIIMDCGDRLAGILVDAVSDIVDVTPDMLRPPPAMGARDSLVLALVVRGDNVIVLPDLAGMVGDIGVLADAALEATVH